jgi:uncharacterized Ntn-hydrolase superfamily protein
MKNLFLLTVIACITTATNAQFFKKDSSFAHTFSAVGRDEVTGEIAVAVQSHWFSVGTVVSWGEAGVGVIATQSFVNKSFGIKGIQLLKQGLSPREVVDSLLSTDAGKEVRQLAVLDIKGRVATHTGKNCIDYAGHLNGENFSVQANMMLNDKVWPAMSSAWKSNSKLPIAERMIEVLKAGQSAGGDIRGEQSAVLLVFAPTASDKPWDDKLIDLRVDDNNEPIKEIERLLKVHRAFDHMNKGDYYSEINDMVKAMEEYNAAMKMFPQNLEMKYWTAITLANNKKVKEASAMLQAIYKKDPNWRELTKRLPRVNLLTVSNKDYAELIK